MTRFYELSIDKQPIAKLGGLSSSAIRIAFDFRVYHGADMPNAVITLTNPPLEFFKNSSKIIGKHCQLKAGISKGVLGSALSLGSSIIGAGYIQNVINDWGKNECSFILSPAPIPTDKTREKGYVIEANSGDAISLAEGALNVLYAGVNVTRDTSSLQVPDKMSVAVHNWVDVSNFLLKLSKDKVRIYASSQGFHISQVKTPNITPLMIKTTDLLEQPNYIEPNKISVTFGLRGDMTIERKLIFSAGIFNTVSPNTNFYATQAKSYISGEWDVISVRHCGDSGSANYKDWATIVEAIQKSKA